MDRSLCDFQVRVVGRPIKGERRRRGETVIKCERQKRNVHIYGDPFYDIWMGENFILNSQLL